MGVVRRQSIKHSIVNLTGLAIGGISVLFLYPHVRAEYGLMQVLLQVGMIGLPLMSLGANTVVFRFFPVFKDKNSGNHGFLPILILMCFLGSALLWGLGLILNQSILHWLGKSSTVLSQYLWLAIPLSFFYVVSVILSQYAANYNRIVVPSLLIDFSQKIILPILLGAVWLEWISMDTALWGLLLHGGLVLTGMLLYIRHLGAWAWKWDRGFIQPELRKEMLRFIGFGALGGFALQLAAKSDIFMVSAMSSLDATGIYAIAAYVAAAIDIPTKSLYGASIALVSKHLAENNIPELHILYRKVAMNLLIAGLLLFGAMWVSVDNLFEIIPNGESMSAGKYVLFFIGMTRLVEMGTGINNYLVYYSRYYLYSLLSLGLLAVASIGLSIWLIPIYGIQGAAIAVLCSTIGYNAVSIGLVWFFFKIQPFTINTLKAVVAAFLTYMMCAQIPFIGNSILDLMFRSSAYVLLFCATILYFRVSSDLNELVTLGWNKLRRK